MEYPKEKPSKPYRVKITENALQNIDDITGYIAYINHQPENAIRVGDAIFEMINRIGLNPFSFRECEEIPTKNKFYRKALCLSWFIVYRIKSSEIIIIGIIHAARRQSKIRSLKRFT